ncbi:3866_t:CDS:2 [Rhizophagus irregularis]|nr:3866_t:CDS:2 [Rhizophagus irregularis]
MSMTVDVENVEGAAVTASSATGRKNLECANIQDNTGAATFAAINAMNNGAIGGVAANQFVGRALAVYIVLQQIIRIKGVKYFKDEDKLAEMVAKTLVEEGSKILTASKRMNSCDNQQEVSKSNSSISDEEEVVDTVNKYRQDLLNEVIPNIPTKKLADHATLEKVVEVK